MCVNVDMDVGASANAGMCEYVSPCMCLYLDVCVEM